jgi:NO-binding membrane sensor protein with MHYT domain
MLDVTFDPILVFASVVIAVMAAFTGLRLTNGLSQLDPVARRPRIAQAAIALGGGIWSMHFVGMLAVSVPVRLTYTALPTLASALVAILVVGVGLIVLHFGARTRTRIVLAGTLTGLGIVAMHYIGMSAISGNCIVGYQTTGLVLSTAIGIGSSIYALDLAYRRRTLGMTALGALALGLAISAMHYSAMIFTTFQAIDQITFVAQPNLSAGMLALIVSVAAFVICGLFLLTAIPLDRSQAAAPVPLGAGEPDADKAQPVRQTAQAVLSKAYVKGGPHERKPDPVERNRIPYERENTVRFFAIDQIAAIRADGHYSWVLNEAGEFFCPWSISRVEQAIGSPSFIRTHRSYLVNLGHVAGFTRDGDKAFCIVRGADETRIPVSRSRIPQVQRALGLA